MRLPGNGIRTGFYGRSMKVEEAEGRLQLDDLTTVCSLSDVLIALEQWPSRLYIEWTGCAFMT
jgi:hypothetical protein